VLLSIFNYILSDIINLKLNIIREPNLTTDKCHHNNNFDKHHMDNNHTCHHSNNFNKHHMDNNHNHESKRVHKSWIIIMNQREFTSHVILIFI
jgi:hypothetical protein